MRDRRKFTLKQKRLIAGTGVAMFLLLTGLVCWYAGRPLIRFVGEPEKFRAWVDERGFRAHLAFLGMVVLQVIVAVIPGEPLEIAAGYAFGALEGTALCVLGESIGSALVFLAVRTLGTRAVDVFFPPEKLKALKVLQDEKRLTFWMFVIFLIPGTPKDVLSYFAGLTPLPFHSWLAISLIARFPSVVTSTVGGNAIGEQRYLFAVTVFAATLLISGLGALVYNRILKSRERKGRRKK